MSNKETYVIEQKFTADTDNLVKGTEKAGASVGGLSNHVDKAKIRLSSFVTTGNVVAGAMAFMGYKTVQAVKDFAKYERQLSSLNTLLKVSKSELQKYGEGFLDLAIKTGASKEELASGAYEALSAGVDASNLISFMETAAKGAAAGMTNVTTSVDTLTSTLNAFKISSSESVDVMDKLITIQNNGKVKLGELSTVMGDVGDIANTLNVSLDEVGASLSTITMNGTTASVAGTRIKAMLGELSKEGSTAYVTFNELAGKSFADFIKNGGTLQEALKLMEEHANKTGVSLNNLFSSMEAGQGAMGLTGKNAETYTKALDAMKDSAGELETAYKLASANIEAEWAKLTATINKKWMTLVSTLEEPIKITLQMTRKALGGQSLDEQLDESTAKLFILEKQLAELEAKRNKLQNSGDWRDIGQIQMLNGQITATMKTLSAAKQQYEKLAAEMEKQKKKQKADSGGNNNGGGGGTDKDPAKVGKERLEKIQKAELEHKSKILKIQNETLQDRSNYLTSLKEQYDSGKLTKDEYDKKLEEADILSNEKQSERMKTALAKLKNFYLQVGETLKAQETEKQILEMEVDLKLKTKDIITPDLTELDEFKAQQLEDQKTFHNSQLVNEWEFMAEVGEQRLQGQINQEEFDQSVNDYKANQALLEKQFQIQQLEELRDFLLAKGDAEIEAHYVQRMINEKKKKLADDSKKIDTEKNKWENWSEQYKVDIQEKSADAIMDTYTALAKGQIKDLDAFKQYCKDKIAELLLAKGQEHMAKGISDTAEAVSTIISNPPLSLSKFAGAAQHFAAAAAFGYASGSLSGGSSGSSESSSTSSTSSDSDVSTAESLESESSSEKMTVYVSTEENATARAMIRILEKELNDEFNLSITGQKKA